MGTHGKILSISQKSHGQKSTFGQKNDQNYDFYLKLSSWLGIDKKLRQKDFLKIKFKNETGYHKSENQKLILSRNEKIEFVSLTKSYKKIYREILKKR